MAPISLIVPFPSSLSKFLSLWSMVLVVHGLLGVSKTILEKLRYQVCFSYHAKLLHCADACIDGAKAMVPKRESRQLVPKRESRQHRDIASLNATHSRSNEHQWCWRGPWRSSVIQRSTHNCIKPKLLGLHLLPTVCYRMEVCTHTHFFNTPKYNNCVIILKEKCLHRCFHDQLN